MNRLSITKGGIVSGHTLSGSQVLVYMGRIRTVDTADGREPLDRYSGIICGMERYSKARRALRLTTEDAWPVASYTDSTRDTSTAVVCEHQKRCDLSQSSCAFFSFVARQR